MVHKRKREKEPALQFAGFDFLFQAVELLVRQHTGIVVLTDSNTAVRHIHARATAFFATEIYFHDILNNC